MAFYLVTARPRRARLDELESELERDAFIHLEPFGKALTKGLRGARHAGSGTAAWEEEDYCRPPLAEEREAVLDEYFEEISVEPVSPGEGWQRIEKLPRLFPRLDS